MPPFPAPADPTALHPMEGQPRVVLLKPLVTSPLIEVGEFSYYDDPTAFETRNVLYHYGPEKLVIGKFCALATGVRFLMNGANHRMDGPSTFPFPMMGGSWTDHRGLLADLPVRGDTVIGNDVWIGHGATVMPGVRIGHGAIVAMRLRRHPRHPRLRRRRRQPRPRHPPPLRREAHRPPPRPRLVGLAPGPPHRTPPHRHVRHRRRPGGCSTPLSALSSPAGA